MIETRQLRLKLGGKRLFRDFDLHVRESERVTLTGRSGSGKTSLLRCLAGFVRPQSGRIAIGGTRLTTRTVWQLRRRIAFVAQSPQLDGEIVRDALEAPFRYKANAGKAPDAQSVARLFESLLLPADMGEKRVEDLSGGEKQRVALAGALLMKRPILLLDEVTSALDEETRDALLAVLLIRRDLTILSISHDPAGFPLGDRIVRMGGTGEASS